MIGGPRHGRRAVARPRRNLPQTLGSGDWLRGRAGGSQTAARLADPYGLRREAPAYDGWTCRTVETYPPAGAGPILGDGRRVGDYLL